MTGRHGLSQYGLVVVSANLKENDVSVFHQNLTTLAVIYAFDC